MIKKIIDWLSTPTQETFYPSESSEDKIIERKQEIKKLLIEKYEKLTPEIKEPTEHEREVVFPYTRYTVKLIDGTSREFILQKDAENINPYSVYHQSVRFLNKIIHDFGEEYNFDNKVYIPRSSVLTIDVEDIPVEEKSDSVAYRLLKTEKIEYPCLKRGEFDAAAIIELKLKLGFVLEEDLLNDRIFEGTKRQCLADIKISEEIQFIS